MAISLDPFQEIVGVGWGGGSVCVLTVSGFALAIAVQDKDKSQIDGLAGFFPEKKADIKTSGFIGVPVNGTTDMTTPMKGIGQTIYIGRGLVDKGGVSFLVGSIQFLSISDEFSQEFMDTHFTFIDGGLKSYSDQRNTFLSKFGSYKIITTKKWEGPGLLGGLFSSSRYSLNYYATDTTKPDYIDLFSTAMLIRFDTTVYGVPELVIVELVGNPQEPITCTAQMVAYAPSSTFVARSNGTIEAFTDSDLKDKASSKWSASGSMSHYKAEVKFDKKGSV